MPKDNQIPTKYLCSITSQIMIDPVMAADGYTYEREAIEQWLQTHDTSPRTNERLEHKKLTSNHDKRSDILEFLDSRPELYEGDEVYLPKAWMAQCATAIKRNQSSEVQRWLDKDRRLLTLKLEGDSTALHLACQFSSPELIDILLKILKQKNQTIPIGGISFKSASLNILLERALDSNDHIKCELLLKLGAEIEQPDASTQNTLLHRMVIKDNQQAAGWLLEKKAVLESRNHEGNTPLLLSVIHNKTKLAEFLLKMKANPQVKNVEQRSPVLIALLNQNKSMLNLLVGAETAALPPLHLALELEDNEIIKTLLREKIESIIEARDEQQRTPFYIAIERRNLEAATLLLAGGANPTVSCGSLQLSVLHIAAERGDVEILKYLLQTKAAVLIDAQNAKGDTPLHLAVQAEHDVIIVQLLEAGAYHKIKNGRGQMPLELAIVEQKPKITNIIMQTVRRLKKAKLKETEVLHQVVIKQTSEIADLRNDLHTQTQNFKTQLSSMQQTIEQERTKNEKYISALQAEIKLLQSAQHELDLQKPVSLIEAIKKNNQEEVFRILNAKVEPLGKKAIDEVDEILLGSPLYWAAAYGRTHFIPLLVKAGIDVNKPDKHRQTPVHVAAQFGHANSITALKGLGANVNTFDCKHNNHTSRTPVYIAAKKGHAAAIAALHAAGADVDILARDNQQQETPIYAAAKKGHARAITALKAAGAVIDTLNQEEETPVYIAAKNGHAAAITALKAAGANMDMPNKHHQTPVCIAIVNGHSEAVTALKVAGANMDIPADYSCSIGFNFFDNRDYGYDDYRNKGITPLYLAAVFGQVAVINMLIAEGANVSMPIKDGTTPLYAAAKYGHADAINALIAAGANVNIPINALLFLVHKSYEGYRDDYSRQEAVKRDKAQAEEERARKDGETPVYVAAKYGHVGAINALIAAGANVNMPTKNGATPVSVAAEYGHEGATSALLEAGADASVCVPAWRWRDSYNRDNGTVLEQISKKFGSNRNDYRNNSSKLIKLLEAHFKQYPLGVKPVLVQEVPPRMLTQFAGVARSASRLMNVNEFKELQEFLKAVAEGEQDKAEAMLKSNHALALVPTDVTDLSKRTFKNITALQYALWALDWRMWTMLLKYIDSKDAAEQINQSEQGLWVPQHGVTANWENLIQALNQYASEVQLNKSNAVYSQTWVKQVGGTQLLLPAHVINEYCYPSRPFDPAPDFHRAETTGAWRTRRINGGEWFSAKVDGQALGEGFAVHRGRGDHARMVYTQENSRYSSLFERDGWSENHGACDAKAIAALLKIRQAQRAAVIAQYLPKPGTVRRVALPPSLQA